MRVIKVDVSFSRPFLWIGKMITFFQSDGNKPVLKASLKVSSSGL